ncbi:MAG: MFS transporter [Gemmatimonadaceae bacterium]|jgi:MFS family permease|nr:MFS transporter [Gemmatimonadaceae bacterium]
MSGALGWLLAAVGAVAIIEPSGGAAALAGVPGWVVWSIGLTLGAATIWQLRNVPRELVLLMITAGIDMIGVLMILPLLPFYAQKLGAGGLTIGLLVSSFSVAQLVSAPIWGRLSDKWGRRPVLLIALASSAVAYLVFGFAHSMFVLFLSRIVQGAGGGTVSVIQAYVADATEPGERTKALGWLSAATNFGVAIGPVLGGYAAAFGKTQIEAGRVSESIGQAAPGIAAALLCVINIVFAFRYLPEVRQRPAAGSAPRPRGASLGAVTRVVSHPGDAPSRLIWIYAIAIGAFQGLTSILALYMSTRFGATEETMGLMFAEIGVLSVITRVFILGRMVDWLGEARLSRVGTVLLAAGIALLPFVPSLQVGAVVIALWPLGTAFTFPAVTGLLSKVISQDDRGLYMGVQQTFGGLSRVIFPIVLGFAFDRDRTHHAPFWISATLVIATLFLSFALPASVTQRPQRARR